MILLPYLSIHIFKPFLYNKFWNHYLTVNNNNIPFDLCNFSVNYIKLICTSFQRREVFTELAVMFQITIWTCYTIFLKHCNFKPFNNVIKVLSFFLQYITFQYKMYNFQLSYLNAYLLDKHVLTSSARSITDLQKWI